MGKPKEVAAKARTTNRRRTTKADMLYWVNDAAGIGLSDYDVISNRAYVGNYRDASEAALVRDFLNAHLPRSIQP